MSKTKKTFLERMKMSDSEQKEGQLSYLVEQNKLQMESDILETQRKIAQLKEELDTKKSQETLQFGSIVEIMSQLQAYAEGLEALKTIKAELFPEK